MSSRVTRNLTIAATILCGLLAGMGVNRCLVDQPAWRELPVQGWAEFSRRADLGNGLFFYPLEGIGAAIATLTAAVAFRLRDKGRPRGAALPLYAAAAFVIGGMIATRFAAPEMLSVRHLDDAVALKRAFDAFDKWGVIRSVLQMSAFISMVWALAALNGSHPRTDRRP